MLNCRNATRLLSKAQERKLSLAERVSLKIHRVICSACDNFGKQMESIRTFSCTYAKSKFDSLTQHNKSEKKPGD